jgi:hypothetical protein
MGAARAAVGPGSHHGRGQLSSDGITDGGEGITRGARNELEATALPSPAGKAVGQVQAAKQAVRERVWEQLERSAAALPSGAYGRIPMFERADAAADRLARLRPASGSSPRAGGRLPSLRHSVPDAGSRRGLPARARRLPATAGREHQQRPREQGRDHPPAACRATPVLTHQIRTLIRGGRLARCMCAPSQADPRHIRSRWSPQISVVASALPARCPAAGRPARARSSARCRPAGPHLGRGRGRQDQQRPAPDGPGPGGDRRGPVPSGWSSGPGSRRNAWSQIRGGAGPVHARGERGHGGHHPSCVASGWGSPVSAARAAATSWVVART